MDQYKYIHFIGIGGIGISSLAFLALNEGKKVTGSDSQGSALIDDLMREGARISIGHQSEQVNDSVELVIYTEAIDRETNPEYLRAKELNLPTLSYFEALGQLTRTKKTIVVVGTHGKTTTTAMLGLTLTECGFDPLVIVGSKVKEFGGRNIRLGKGDLFAVEGCEYRRSFLNLAPFGVIFLNCELEHLDYYKNESDYLAAYKELIGMIPSNGFLVANMEDPNVADLSHHCAGRVIPVHESDASSLNLKLNVFGRFNQLNATQAYKAAEAVGGTEDAIRRGLEAFRGTWRRMEHRGKFNGALLIDDYGHHPTELKMTLKAIKEYYSDKRLICVFQPHQYSRTHLLIEEFKDAFKSADKVLITDIYAARDTDEDKAKIDAEKMVKIISAHHNDIQWSGDLENTYRLLNQIVQSGDVLVTMGAGSIGQLADRLAQT